MEKDSTLIHCIEVHLVHEERQNLGTPNSESIYIFKKKSIQLLNLSHSSSFIQLPVIHIYAFFLQFKIFNGFPVLHLESEEE